MSEPEPEPGRVVRQLRHDVDDVYGLLSEVAQTQREHGGRLDRIQREHGDRLDRIDSRLGGLEQTQQQILELLRGGERPTE